MLSRFWTWLFRSQTLQFLLIVLLIVLAIVFVAVPVSKSFEACILKSLGLEEDAKYEALKFLGISMGGVLVALQALMSYQRAKAMEKTAEAQADAANAQARATEEQAKANQHTEQGQQQERFRNAIEHLGHKSDSVRLGGAYELFHLVQDTPETPELRQTVHDILCAHIRQTTGEKEYREKHKSKPSEEVQSLLNLLFVQEHEFFKGCHINLQGSWLKGVALKRARLENAILGRSATAKGRPSGGATARSRPFGGENAGGNASRSATAKSDLLGGADARSEPFRCTTTRGNASKSENARGNASRSENARGGPFGFGTARGNASSSTTARDDTSRSENARHYHREW